MGSTPGDRKQLLIFLRLNESGTAVVVDPGTDSGTDGGGGSSGSGAAQVTGTDVIVCLEKNGVEATANSFPYIPVDQPFKRIENDQHIIAEAILRYPAALSYSLSGVCVTLTFRDGEVPASPQNIAVQ